MNIDKLFPLLTSIFGIHQCDVHRTKARRTDYVGNKFSTPPGAEIRSHGVVPNGSHNIRSVKFGPDQAAYFEEKSPESDVESHYGAFQSHRPAPANDVPTWSHVGGGHTAVSEVTKSWLPAVTANTEPPPLPAATKVPHHASAPMPQPPQKLAASANTGMPMQTRTVAPILKTSPQVPHTIVPLPPTLRAGVTTASAMHVRAVNSGRAMVAAQESSPPRAVLPYKSKYSGEEVSMTLPPKEYGAAFGTRNDGDQPTLTLPAIDYSEYKQRERQGTLPELGKYVHKEPSRIDQAYAEYVGSEISHIPYERKSGEERKRHTVINSTNGHALSAGRDPMSSVNQYTDYSKEGSYVTADENMKFRQSVRR